MGPGDGDTSRRGDVSGLGDSEEVGPGVGNTSRRGDVSGLEDNEGDSEEVGPGHQESAIPPAEATSLVSMTVKETARRWDQGSAIPPAGGTRRLFLAL